MKPHRFKNQETAQAYMMGVIDTRKEILGSDKTQNPRTNFDNVAASPETLAKFIVNPENHFCCLGGCPFNMNGERLCDYEYEHCEECATAWLNKEVEKGE